MISTVRELIASLEEVLAEAGKDDVELRVASQPSYPLANAIDAVSLERQGRPRGLYRTAEEPVCWIAIDQVDSPEHPYAPRDAWDGGVF